MKSALREDALFRRRFIPKARFPLGHLRVESATETIDSFDQQ